MRLISGHNYFIQKQQTYSFWGVVSIPSPRRKGCSPCAAYDVRNTLINKFVQSIVIFIQLTNDYRLKLTKRRHSHQHQPQALMDQDPLGSLCPLSIPVKSSKNAPLASNSLFLEVLMDKKCIGINFTFSQSYPSLTFKHKTGVRIRLRLF